VRRRLLELKAVELTIRRAHLIVDCEAQEPREHLLAIRDASAWDAELARAVQSRHFRPIGEAATRVVEKLSQNRARRVDAPLPQSASERRKGITTTQEDE
jgi:hypothetical protein